MRELARLQTLLTPEEVAKLLQISRKTVMAIVRRGELPCVRIGNRCRFRPDEVAAWLLGKGGSR